MITAVLMLSVLFSACQGDVSQGERPTDTATALAQVQSGTQGVRAKFVQNYPPNTLYDINDFVALIEVTNKGATTVNPGQCFLQVTGFDPGIITGINYIQGCGIVDGKSVYNLDGGFNQLEYQSTDLNLPFGTLDYKPNLNLVWCYNYETHASPLVCLDPVFYQISNEQKACEPRDVLMGGGQGGPVSIGYVGVDMVGDQAVFEISVRNSGTGQVLSRNSDITNCGNANIDYDDVDKVQYRVEMTSGGLMDCSPGDGVVRLVNGQGKIICKSRINSATAFETPLQISLFYNYMDSMQRQVQIIQTP